MALPGFVDYHLWTPNLPEYGLGFEENDECVVHAGLFPLSVKSKCKCHWATACCRLLPWLCSLTGFSSGCLLGEASFL